MLDAGPNVMGGTRWGQRFWTILLISTGLATVVSTIGTFAGLNLFMSSWVAGASALAVQLALFALAWLIGLHRTRGRWLIVAIYAFVMIFSVLFSYVFFQDKLTADARPAASQRALRDSIAVVQSRLARMVGESRSSADEAVALIENWLELERTIGFSTRTCAAALSPYLGAACQRVRDEIKTWEDSTGREYRQGPGARLIHGLLVGERAVAQQRAQRLSAYATRVGQVTAVPDSSSNASRIDRLNEVLAAVPLRDLSEFGVEGAKLPAPMAYGSFTVDAAGDRETPLLAFHELADAVQGRRRGDPLTPMSAATLVAFALAMFFDLLVLFAAVAGYIAFRPHSRNRWNIREPLGAEDDVQVRRNVDDWIRFSFLRPRTPEHSQELVSRILKLLKSHDGESEFVNPSSDVERRFLDAMRRANAAVRYDSDSGGAAAYLLRPWAVQMLSRYIAMAERQEEPEEEFAS